MINIDRMAGQAGKQVNLYNLIKTGIEFIGTKGQYTSLFLQNIATAHVINL